MSNYKFKVLQFSSTMELVDIKTQDLSGLICNFMICKRCGIVDREMSRIRVDSLCPACNEPGGVARLYFHINISILIDLIQQSYHSEWPGDDRGSVQSSNVSVLLFFCTLRETLLDNLFTHLIWVQKIPDRIADRLRNDNKLISQKFSSLFPALVGKTWSEAVEEASSYKSIDFKPVSDLMKSTSTLRNRFIHEASGWSITREVATECVNSLDTLLRLFVALHNVYVQPKVSAADF